MSVQNNKAWWLEEDPKLRLNAAQAAYTHLKSHDKREEAYRQFLSLYTNRDQNAGLGLAGYLHAATSVEENKFSRVPFNVIKLMIDTISARVAKMKPRPRYLTNEGDYGLKRRADRLQKWVDMQFYTTELNKIAPRVFIDACIYGIGAAKVSRNGDEILCERVYPGELLVDEHEAFHDTPHQLYQTKFISKDVLNAMFPGNEEVIDMSSTIVDREDEDLEQSPLVDQIEVVEAWHLRSGPKAPDGRRIVFTSAGILADVPYEHRDFPFSFVRWMQEPRGFYGIGLAEDLIGVHRDINFMIRKTERAFELTATPQVWIPESAGVSAKNITNIPGAINHYRGNVAPKFFAPQSVAPDVFAYMQQQLGRARQIARLSDTSTGGRIPNGLETGQAVRNFHEIETESFSLVAQQYEDMFLDIAKKYVRTGKEIAQANKNYTVVLEKDKYTVEEVPWKDVQLDDRKDAFVVKVFPASSLPYGVSGRFAAIQDMLNMQLVTPQEGKGLLNIPDLDEHLSLDRAAADNIDRIMEKILEKDVYEPPEPFMDLQLAMKKAQASVNKASRMGVPEGRVQKLRLFTKQCSDMMKAAEAEAVAMQQMAAMQPAAAPPPDGSGQLPGAVTGQEL